MGAQNFGPVLLLYLQPRHLSDSRTCRSTALSLLQRSKTVFSWQVRVHTAHLLWLLLFLQLQVTAQAILDFRITVRRCRRWTLSTSLHSTVSCISSAGKRIRGSSLWSLPINCGPFCCMGAFGVCKNGALLQHTAGYQ